MKIIKVLFAVGFASNFADESRDEQVNFSRRNNYGASCYGYSLSGTVLSAICQKIDQSWTVTSIDLEKIVGNTNGQLTMRRREISKFERQQLTSEMNANMLYASLIFFS
jgi:hypothetical protein